MRLTTFKKRHSCVAKDKSFGTAGTRPPQRSQLPSSFSPSWASEPLWDSDRWEASPHWPFLNSATSPQVSVIVFLRGEAHGDTDLLGQEQKFRNYLREGVWMRWMWGSTLEDCNAWKHFPLNTFWDLRLLLPTDSCSPQIHMLKPQLLVPQSMTVF